jgi:transcriptional regulator with XRE-family HTH domain
VNREDLSMELLVPPRRLGRLLAQARVSRGLSLEDVCDELDGRLTEIELLEFETGRRPVNDQELEALAGLYDVETSTMVPSRSELVIDLDDGVIRAGGSAVEVTAPTERRDVLSKYLALVYSMRGQEPGTTVTLRLADLDILSDAFAANRRTIEDELVDLMVATPEPVKKRFRLLRGRLMVPVVGVLVAATAGGSRVLVPAKDSSADEGDPSARIELPANPEVHVADAAVQERLPDGTPGPVESRN